MTEFATTATHDGRAVPMPEVNAATCDWDLLDRLETAYLCHTTRPRYIELVYFRDRVAADARAIAAPSEDAIRAAKFEALNEAAKEYESLYGSVVLQDYLRNMAKHYAPRPVYAAPVRLSDGRTFGQTGQDAFELARSGVGKRVDSAKNWRLVDAFTPADGALVLAVLDGAEATR